MSYKIYYNSKLAKALTFLKGFSTMMFFGSVITEEESLNFWEKRHEECHVYQYRDCKILGAYVFLILLFSLLFSGVESPWLLLLILLPWVFYYVLYGVEFLFRWIFYGFNTNKAYENISFEKQARQYEKDVDSNYSSFSFWFGNGKRRKV